MKLLVVSPSFYPNIGGAQNYALNISRILKEKYKWDVVVITSGHKNNKISREDVKGLVVYRMPYLFKISNTPISPFWFNSIRKIINIEKPDIKRSY